MSIKDDQGNEGTIEGSFGKSGKVKCHFPKANFPTKKEEAKNAPSKLGEATLSSAMKCRGACCFMCVALDSYFFPASDGVQKIHL